MIPLVVPWLVLRVILRVGLRMTGRVSVSASPSLCLWLCWLSLAACTREAPVLTGSTMGTSYSVIVPGIKKSDQTNLKLQVDARLQEVNASMSTWQKTSTISRFNDSATTDWFEVSKGFALVTGAALEIATRTGGAFDPTVGPLVRRWGFGKDPDNSIPTADEISELAVLTGFENLQVDADSLSIKKSISRLQLDLNAIAKGYAVDLLAAEVAAFGYRNYLVEIGGELRVSGVNADGDPWRIGIEHPNAARPEDHLLTDRGPGLYLTKGGIATSGDYRNAFESDGVRYSHIIDARTGSPVSHSLASVTVVADSAMMADGWATALMVLGPDEGMKIAEQLGLASFFIVRDGEGFTTLASREFDGLARN